jgi:hypothetical protein
LYLIYTKDVVLFVIAAANASKFRPEYAVVLKGTPLLSKCCYSETPANQYEILQW